MSTKPKKTSKKKSQSEANASYAIQCFTALRDELFDMSRRFTTLVGQADVALKKILPVTKASTNSTPFGDGKTADGKWPCRYSECKKKYIHEPSRINHEKKAHGSVYSKRPSKQ